MEGDGDPARAVEPHKIDTSDLVLVRLDHVSKGSWQAQLQLIRPWSCESLNFMSCLAFSLFSGLVAHHVHLTSRLFHFAFSPHLSSYTARCSYRRSGCLLVLVCITCVCF